MPLISLIRIPHPHPHPHSAVPFVYQRPGQVTHDPCYLRHKLPTECSPSTAHSSSAFLIRIPHPHSVPHDMIVRHWPSAAPPTPGSGIHVAVGIGYPQNAALIPPLFERSFLILIRSHFMIRHRLPAWSVKVLVTWMPHLPPSFPRSVLPCNLCCWTFDKKKKDNELWYKVIKVINQS